MVGSRGTLRLKFCSGRFRGERPSIRCLALLRASVRRNVTASGSAKWFRSNNERYFFLSVVQLSCGLWVSTHIERYPLLMPGKDLPQVSFLSLRICRNYEMITEVGIVCVILLDLHSLPLFSFWAAPRSLWDLGSLTRD